MKRRIALAIGIGLLITAVPTLAGLSYVGWDGASHTRTLLPGQSVTLESGLTFTVPAGWEAVYTKYFWIPSGLPIGDGAGGLHRSEYLALRTAGNIDSGDPVAVLTFYSNGRPPKAGVVLAKGPEVTVSSSFPSGVNAVVETRVPGHRRGYALLGAMASTPLESARSVWSTMKVGGATLP